jgi:hypothetical protein
MRRLVCTALLGASFGVTITGCQIAAWLAGDGTGGAADHDPEVEGVGMIPPTPDVGTARPPGPLERARLKLKYVTKDARHLGFNLRTLADTFALAGAPEVPEWSDPGEGDPLDVRDDDLATGWRCTPSRETTCAFGVHFPEPATVSSVRLWAGNPAAQGEKAHPRLAQIRVHTDEGYGDVLYADEQDFAFAIFGRPVTTRQLTVEVLAVHEGEKSQTLWLGDLEVYGESGVPRPPLTIDPATAVVRPGGDAWRKSGMTHKLEGSFVDLVQPDGSTQRFAPGSALIGRAGDRIILLEQLLQTVCKVQQGRYFAIDTQTRVWLPLGDLGGIPGDVFAHGKGMGFAVGYVDPDVARVQGIFLETDTYVRSKTQRMDREPYTAVFAAWGVTDGVVPRGGFDASAPSEPCHAAEADDLAALAKARGGKAPADRFTACDLGRDHTALLSSGGRCGSSWEVYVLGPSGRVVAQRKGTGRKGGARLRARVSAELGLLVEVGDATDATRTFVVRTDDIVDLPEGTALAVRPPAACRKQCDDEFSNPRRPG